jgi:hypothetical protein
MSDPVRVNDVVVGLLTENTLRMLTQAIRLVRSIRWFGGELAGVRIVVCGVGPLESTARETLEALGVEIRTVSRFHPANPTGNRHQLLAELLDAPEEILFLLDCDTIVVQDPLPYLSGVAVQAKIAPTPTVSDEVFERLFAHFGLTKPARSYVASLSGTLTIPYFNAGVLAIPKALARTLAPAWRKYNLVLADHPELVAPCQRHMHQASLSLALVETGVPHAEWPAAMNFQINATHVPPPPGFAETDPVILHYHYLATDDGLLLPCPYPAAQARIEKYHERMNAEGLVRATGLVQEARVEEARAEKAWESRPIVVLGMHRSGTSVVTQLIHAMGAYAGQPDELMPADMFNPTGFWEHGAAVEIDTEILDALGADWSDIRAVEISRLSEEQRAGFIARARRLVQSLQGRGAFVLKDPRMSLLFPLWQEALTNPVCVIVWREPMAVARSLTTRDRLPLLISLAVWDHYNRRVLRDTEGLPRVLVSYEELLAEPDRVVRKLHAELTALGMEGLRVPSGENLEQIVKSDFNRSGRAPAAPILDGDQRALLADLRSGAVLRGSVGPTPAHRFEILARFDEIDALKQDVADRDQLLGAVFESRSWRLGHWLTGVLRLLRPGTISAVDRWREMRKGRGEGKR